MQRGMPPSALQSRSQEDADWDLAHDQAAFLKGLASWHWKVGGL